MQQKAANDQPHVKGKNIVPSLDLSKIQRDVTEEDQDTIEPADLIYE